MPEARDSLGPADSSHHTHFVLTLARLERLYALRRGEVLRELLAASVPVLAAQQALQDAYASAARRRFDFRSEQAVVAWVRREAWANGSSRSTSLSADPAPVTEWDDVLRRANIAISESPSLGLAPTTSRSIAWLRALWSAGARRRARNKERHNSDQRVGGQ
jgi:hypothetical protein